MNRSVTIASVSDGTRLIFSHVVGEMFSATLESPAFSGRVAASTYYSGPPSSLFAEMAAEWRGWQGTKEWTAIDQELHLGANADRVGHIEMNVVMQMADGAANWRLEATLHLEAGQLEALSRTVDLFFA